MKKAVLKNLEYHLKPYTTLSGCEADVIIAVVLDTLNKQKNKASQGTFILADGQEEGLQPKTLIRFDLPLIPDIAGQKEPPIVDYAQIAKDTINSCHKDKEGEKRYGIFTTYDGNNILYLKATSIHFLCTFITDNGSGNNILMAVSETLSFLRREDNILKESVDAIHKYFYGWESTYNSFGFTFPDTIDTITFTDVSILLNHSTLLPEIQAWEKWYKTEMSALAMQKKRIGIDFLEKHLDNLHDFIFISLRYKDGSKNITGNENSSDGSYTVEGWDWTERDLDWDYVDKCYGRGGESYSGMATIFYKGVVCWTMGYFGKVLPGIDKESVYSVLHLALLKASRINPLRGPNWFIAENGMAYINICHGDIVKFHGQERIKDKDDNWLYECDYQGGIVNLP